MAHKRKYITDRLRRSRRPLSGKYLASCYSKIRYASYAEAKERAVTLVNAQRISITSAITTTWVVGQSRNGIKALH